MYTENSYLYILMIKDKIKRNVHLFVKIKVVKNIDFVLLNV